MTILSDGELRGAIARGEIAFEPEIDLSTQLQPASVDLRLGRSFASFRSLWPLSSPIIKPGETDVESLMERSEGEQYVLPPGEFVLATTMETVWVAPFFVARVEGRSSFGRLGLMVHVTAGLIDPGVEGEITLEMANAGRFPLVLRSGTRICQLVFERLGREAEQPYGVKEGAKYQGQKGATASRLGNRG